MSSISFQAGATTLKRLSGEPIRPGYALAAAVMLAVLLALGAWELTARPAPVPVNYAALKVSGVGSYARGDYDRAVPKLNAYLRAYPKDAKIRSLAASASWQAGRFKDAYGHYERLLKLRPGDTEVLHLLGVTANRLNRPDEALVYALRAARANPQSPAVQSRLARAYQRDHRFREAIAVWDRVLSDFADQFDRSEVYAEMASASLALGDKDKAKEYIRAGLGLDGGNQRLLQLTARLDEG